MVSLYLSTTNIKVWYLDDIWHRDNGPAVTLSNGCPEWWWHNRRVTEYEHMILAGQETVND